MAKAECNVISRPIQALRHCVVGYVPDSYQHPQITIKGKWLREVGFNTGMELNVRVMDGCLVVTAEQMRPADTELQRSLKTANQLSDTSQHELAQIIHGLMLKEKLLPKTA
ncbi:SymE family type I addiction module toxin [Rouxiella sp. Mn2063]|uniref:SymE family type I addiction module toxin n=1 Tax=Rouxiella sp. Mn2063 TaxID=3395262 RepID=UPI003BDC42C1